MKPYTQTKLFNLVRRYVNLLDRSDYPKDGICSHHGVSFKCDDNAISISNFYGKLLVSCYTFSHIKGSPKEEHDRNRDIILAATGQSLYDSWNGGDGSIGISVCLNRPCPESLMRANANYRALDCVFDTSEEENACFKKFTDWIKAGMAEVGIKNQTPSVLSTVWKKIKNIYKQYYGL